MIHARLGGLALLCTLPAMTGCLQTTRSVMQTHPPGRVMSSSLETLVKATTDRYTAIHTLRASVEVTASVGGGKKGSVTEYTSFSAYILMRQPQDFRFIGLVPITRTRMLDMVTNGKSFVMVVPPKNRAITGSNDIATPSSNPLENLRPQVFTDSLLIRSASADEMVSLVSDDRIYQPDPNKKYVVDEPEYDIGIYRSVTNSTELKTQRVIHIGRSTLLPYQQDIYDERGQLTTVATYDDYKLFGQTTFPTRITIRRPLDQLSLKLVVTELAANQTMDDEQFEEPKIPASYQVQHLP